MTGYKYSGNSLLRLPSDQETLVGLTGLSNKKTDKWGGRRAGFHCNSEAYRHLVQVAICFARPSYSAENLEQDRILSIKNDFLKHKQANISVESRRFGVIMTPLSRQSE